MEVIRKPIGQLSYDPNNARKHDPKNIEAIKGSLRKFKQQKPIVITRDNIVIAGNGTLQAAKELEWIEIDCVVTDLESFNATAFALADNRTAELAEWDEGVLAETLKNLDDFEFDIGDIGFDVNVSESESSQLPEDEKQFLRSAAERHKVFNYENIAEYYAHSSKDCQELMEDSALVIIDFNKAIENGFVKMSREISEVYASEQN